MLSGERLGLLSGGAGDAEQIDHLTLEVESVASRLEASSRSWIRRSGSGLGQNGLDQPFVVDAAPLEQLSVALDAGERIAQLVAGHRDEGVAGANLLLG